MSAQASSNAAPEPPPRSWIGQSALAGLVLFAVGGAVCGATGVCRSEYKAGPRDEAILVGLMVAPYGLVTGLLFGLIANGLRRWWRHRSYAEARKSSAQEGPDCVPEQELGRAGTPGRFPMSTVTPASDPWLVFEYEANMFFALCSLLQERNPEYAALPGAVQTAVVESALLHARQLVDILLSRRTDPNDIKLGNLLPDYRPTQLEELRQAYGNRNAVGSPCWTLNKRLAHATSHRGDSHDYTSLLKHLGPLVGGIVQEVRIRRPIGGPA